MLDLGALEEAARGSLPQAAYDYIAGGAEDERTMADNVAAWDRVRLRPRVLRDVSGVDTRITVLGHEVAAPILVAPTAAHRLVHPDGEAATAAGTAAAGSLLVLSTRTTVPVEEVAPHLGGAPWWLQVYVVTDKQYTADIVTAAVAHGCTGLVLTGDTPVIGRRRRDERNHFSYGGKPGTSLGLDQDPAVTFDAVTWLHEHGRGLPVMVKGVLRDDDARACVDAGAAAVIVSNHGGRQLDGALATADALPEVVEAVAGRAEVYVDGGVRRGADVVRALALGARAVLLGRPVVWGLATGGADGVRDVLDGLRLELARDMALSGAPTVADVTADLVFRG